MASCLLWFYCLFKYKRIFLECNIIFLESLGLNRLNFFLLLKVRGRISHLRPHSGELIALCLMSSYPWSSLEATQNLIGNFSLLVILSSRCSLQTCCTRFLWLPSSWSGGIWCCGQHSKPNIHPVIPHSYWPRKLGNFYSERWVFRGTPIGRGKRETQEPLRHPGFIGDMRVLLCVRIGEAHCTI